MIARRLTVPFAVAVLVPAVALADGRYQYAQVVGSEPIYDTVSYTVPREQCRLETVRYREPVRERPRSATAPIVGAIVGGAIGNAVGHKKRNKQVGAVVGALLGGSIGADVSRRRAAERDGGYYGRYSASSGYGTEEVCTTVEEQHYEERLTGYRVTYRYGGETYTTMLDHDPGPSLRVRVNVTPVG